MNGDIELLSALSVRDLFYRVHPYMKEHAVSEQAWVVLECMDEWFKSSTEDSINWDTFPTLLRTIKGSDKRLPELVHLASDVAKCAASGSGTSPDIEKVIEQYVARDYAMRIVHEASKVVKGVKGASLASIGNLVEDFNKETGALVSPDDLFVSTDLVNLVCDKKIAGGFKWRLEELNKSVGPIGRGDLVILGARPETGKTTFLAAEASFFATQIKDDRPIVWVNNEERSTRVMKRVIQAYFGVDRKTLADNDTHYSEVYNDEVGKRILILDDTLLLNSVEKLDAVFTQLNPCLIIFDQLDKVEGFGNAAREDMRLGLIYFWARNCAKKYGPVIAATQASGEAENVKWITQNMLRGSKTDKAGEADVIITIGRTEESESARYIHIPKNKLDGDEFTEDALKHGYFEVVINPFTARYESAL